MNGETSFIGRHKGKAVGVASTAALGGTLFTADQISKLSDAREQIATLRHQALVCEHRSEKSDNQLVEAWIIIQDQRIQIRVLQDAVAGLRERPQP